MQKPTAVIGAMNEELELLLQSVKVENRRERAGLQFVEGHFENRPLVAVRSGIGKVNAALCTQLLVDLYHPWGIINTGVAGGIDSAVEIGDLVLSEAAVHHDMDIQALGLAPGIIMGMETSRFTADPRLLQLAKTAAAGVFEPHQIHTGVVATGDQFISSVEKRHWIAKTFQALCAEMEGAAVAQTAYVNNVPFVIVRGVSDKADASSPTNFTAFLRSTIPQLTAVVTSAIRRF